MIGICEARRRGGRKKRKKKMHLKVSKGGGIQEVGDFMRDMRQMRAKVERRRGFIGEDDMTMRQRKPRRSRTEIHVKERAKMKRLLRRRNNRSVGSDNTWRDHTKVQEDGEPIRVEHISEGKDRPFWDS